MKRKRAMFSTSSQKEVSVIATLLRTFFLVGVTFLLMLLVRVFPPASHLVQHVASTSAWQQLYSVFHIETALGREQLILAAIVLTCFIIALLVQLICLWILRCIRRRGR